MTDATVDADQESKLEAAREAGYRWIDSLIDLGRTDLIEPVVVSREVPKDMADISRQLLERVGDVTNLEGVRILHRRRPGMIDIVLADAFRFPGKRGHDLYQLRIAFRQGRLARLGQGKRDHNPYPTHQRSWHEAWNSGWTEENLRDKGLAEENVKSLQEKTTALDKLFEEKPVGVKERFVVDGVGFVRDGQWFAGITVNGVDFTIQEVLEALRVHQSRTTAVFPDSAREAQIAMNKAFEDGKVAFRESRKKSDNPWNEGTGPWHSWNSGYDFEELNGTNSNGWPIGTNAQLNAAYEAGKAAQKAGRSRDSNPHGWATAQPEHREWNNGYTYAEQER